MKTKITNVFLIALMLFLISCDEDYRLNNMVDDQVYLLKSGITTEKMFLVDNYLYDVFVIKSGVGQQAVDLELRINPNLLNQYNDDSKTDYLLLPENFYSIKKRNVQMQVDDYKSSFQIQFDLPKILDLQQGTGKQYILPCEIKVLNSTVKIADSTKSYSLILPVIEKPYIEFNVNQYSDISKNLLSSLRLEVSHKYSGDIERYYTKISTNFPNEENISFKVEVDPMLIDEHNLRNQTSYKLLPERAYDLIEEEWIIKKNFNYQPLGFRIIKEGLYDQKDPLYDEYMLPLRISFVSQYEINEQQSVLLIPITFQPIKLDRTNWEVIEWNSCIVEEPQYTTNTSTPDKMFDGSVATWWASRWDNPNPLPYYHIIDMKKEYNINRVDIIKPAGSTWRGYLSDGYFEISSDNVTWRKLADWSIDKNVTREHRFAVKRSTARYIKFVITHAFSYKGEGSQINVAEFVVWGD